MSDITKCFLGCEKQETCYRWTAPDSKCRQSYAFFKDRMTTGECPAYWPNGKAQEKPNEPS